MSALHRSDCHPSVSFSVAFRAPRILREASASAQRSIRWTVAVGRSVREGEWLTSTVSYALSRV